MIDTIVLWNLKTSALKEIIINSLRRNINSFWEVYFEKNNYFLYATYQVIDIY